MNYRHPDHEHARSARLSRSVSSSDAMMLNRQPEVRTRMGMAASLAEGMPRRKLSAEDVMKRSRKCGECAGTDIRMAVVPAGGGYAPDLLPGAHPWWKSATLEVYVCCVCGHFQYFVPDAVLPFVRTSKKFKPI